MLNIYEYKKTWDMYGTYINDTPPHPPVLLGPIFPQGGHCSYHMRLSFISHFSFKKGPIQLIIIQDKQLTQDGLKWEVDKAGPSSYILRRVYLIIYWVPWQLLLNPS